MAKDTNTKVKTKLDEIGVTYVATTTVDKVSHTAKDVGSYIYDKAKVASEKVNEKIESNEKLSNAKHTTSEKLG